MAQIKLPKLKLSAISIESLNSILEMSEIGGIDNAQINPSCILSYLGIRGIGYNNTSSDVLRNFNAVPYLAYWDIYKNYYANKQEEIGAVIHKNTTEIITTVSAINVTTNGIVASVPSTPTGSVGMNNTSQISIGYTGTPPIPNQINLSISYRDWETDRKSTRLNSSHSGESRMPSSA